MKEAKQILLDAAKQLSAHDPARTVLYAAWGYLDGVRSITPSGFHVDTMLQCAEERA